MGAICRAISMPAVKAACSRGVMGEPFRSVSATDQPRSPAGTRFRHWPARGLRRLQHAAGHRQLGGTGGISLDILAAQGALEGGDSRGVRPVALDADEQGQDLGGNGPAGGGGGRHAAGLPIPCHAVSNATDR